MDSDCKEFCNFQCLYSTDVVTGFPLQELQGQWTWVYGSLLQWQWTTSLRFHLLFLPAITTEQLSRPWVECAHQSEGHYPVCCNLCQNLKMKVLGSIKAAAWNFLLAKKLEETQMATANSCSGTKKTEDMSVEEVCDWIKTNFDNVAAKIAWKVQLCQKCMSFISKLFSFKQNKQLMEKASFC